MPKPMEHWLANTAGTLRWYPVKCAFSILETVFRLFNAYFIGNPFISARPCYPYLYPIYGLCWIAFLLLPAVNWFSSKWLHFLSSLQLFARLLYCRLSCDSFDIASVPQISPLIDSHKQFQNILFDKYLSPSHSQNGLEKGTGSLSHSTSFLSVFWPIPV